MEREKRPQKTSEAATVVKIISIFAIACGGIGAYINSLGIAKHELEIREAVSLNAPKELIQTYQNQANSDWINVGLGTLGVVGGVFVFKKASGKAR